MCRCACSWSIARSIGKMTNVECRLLVIHRVTLAERTVFDLVISMDTQLTWYGQSAFKIVTPSGKVLLVDPWLSNPVFEDAKKEIAGLKHVDLILITHGHSDHVGDAVDIGKK